MINDKVKAWAAGYDIGRKQGWDDAIALIIGERLDHNSDAESKAYNLALEHACDAIRRKMLS